jgi:hypothetical protein
MMMKQVTLISDRLNHFGYQSLGRIPRLVTLELKSSTCYGERTQYNQFLQRSKILEQTMPLHDDETSYTDFR